MSLIDAFLLDPARINVLVANRTDGSLGAGTQMDPLNATFNNTASFTPSAISRTTTTATVTLTAHPFKVGDRVLVAGATGADGSLYNGSFTVATIATNTFTYIMVGTPSANAAGTFSVRIDPYRFDAVMRSLASAGPVCIYLGPGEFKTLGYYEGLSGGAQLKPGMRIVGSGVDVTKVTLVNTTANTQKAVYAFGHDLGVGGAANLVDFASIESLTVDCNLNGQSGAMVAAGAVRMMGNHSRVSFVKAINWGNKHDATPTPGFVFLLITGDLSAGVGVAGVVNCGIDQCLAITPTLPPTPPTAPVTVFQVGAKEVPSGTAASGDAPYIRNCYLDAGQVNSFGHDVRAISMSWCKAGVDESHLAECILALENDEALRREYGVKARAFAETLDWSRLIPSWLEAVGFAR